MSFSLRAEQLSKRFRVSWSDVHADYRTLREDVMGLFRRPLAWLKGTPTDTTNEDFWALREVDLDVAPGEIVGIVGRNGAGKSTLLKIISGITKPTSGRLLLRGRVGSLLEVGVGFHPELSGRENILLAGAIAGMRHAEIRAKFDQIVAFSEIEGFLDTPVKRYSSGMYVRLAFSVAAHLESEILVVDEVLAVGDAAFQRKCLGQLHETTQSGRTVLFVSHNMGAIRQVCQSCLWLDEGKVRDRGEPAEVIGNYLKQVRPETTSEITFDEDERLPFQLRAVRLLDLQGERQSTFTCDEPVVLEMDCVSRKRVRMLFGQIHLLSSRDGALIYEGDSHDRGENPFDQMEPGRWRVRWTLPARLLAPGSYDVHLDFVSHMSDGPRNIFSPGITCTFELNDFASTLGAKRRGHLGALIAWEATMEQGQREGE
ncbi:Teichoic acids export ATP-binding protein TagH [Planctomycetes bacterium Pan216]|uniref:Teichoic acids export ATP-binding protein TagH n=1 Tax=Kolteria novifilia TaxID=2527975 RepID=A0A518AWY0_9BACT|nr:Teichoic acids export ATP-binding protein TagH [Planctomycetes bacterium Pan216]